MKATKIFFPKASSPSAIAGPSATTCPFFTFCPLRTIGFWLIQVFWFDLQYFNRGIISTPAPDLRSPEDLRTTREASTLSTTPSSGAMTANPESRATYASIPVPTRGGSQTIRGTACRCLLDPMSARFASSCSRKGIKEAATLTSWLGETSMRSTRLLGISANSPRYRADTNSFTNLP